MKTYLIRIIRWRVMRNVILLRRSYEYGTFALLGFVHL